MDLNNPVELRSELSRLYRALDESEGEVKKLTNSNSTLKSDRDLLFSSTTTLDGPSSTGHAAKKIIELGKKIRQLTTEVESEKTKLRNAEKSKREMKSQNEQLHAKLKQSNIELGSFSEVSSAYSVDAVSKRYESQIKNYLKNEKAFQVQIEQLQLEIKSQKKVMEAELGCTVSSSQVMGGNWKGRQQQIIALQARIKELERIKSESATFPRQIKQMKKENCDLMEKYKTLVKEKDDQIDSVNKKSAMTKTRSQTLTNQQRVLKEQILALEEKGRHDDELIEALTARLKATSIKETKSPLKSSPVRLESKESIVEIKQLRTKIANLENNLNSKDLELTCMQKANRVEKMSIIHGKYDFSTLHQTVDSLTLTMEKSYQNAPENIRTFERDSLDLEAKNDPNSEVHFQVQIDTLTKENKSLSRQLDEARSQHNDTVNSLLDKKRPADELTADDLRSLRIVLQTQIAGRTKDAKYYQELLEENRMAYLEAVQIIRK